MFFELKGIVDRFALQPEAFDASITLATTVHVRLWNSTPSEQLLGEPTPWAHFSANAEVPVSAALERSIDQTITNLAFHWFPVDLQGEIDGHRGLLNAAVNQVVNTLRWRFGMRGSTHPLENLELGYSLDGKTWGSISEKWDYRLLENVGTPPSWYTGLATYDDAQRLMRLGQYEPIGHDLFREAWTLRWDSPRSALLVGIAAIEVGTKRCVATLEPSSEKSMRNDSMSVKALLTEILPNLRAGMPDDEKLLPSDDMIATVHAGIQARNALVHRFPGEPKYDQALQQLVGPQLDALLATISDFLWLFDIYTGHQWARQFVRPITLQVLESAYT